MQIVRHLDPVATAINLNSSLSPSQLGEEVSFTAVLLANGMPATSATGNVIFRVADVPVSSNSLSSGTATFAISSLPGGTNLVSAEYLGDANFLGANQSMSHIVNRPPTASPFYAGVLSGGVVVITNGSGQKAFVGDPDGDELTFTALGDPINGSAAVTDTGASLTYTNLGGTPPFEDLFSYEVSDGRGGVASSTISVQVFSADTLGRLYSSGLSANGYLTLNQLGFPGTDYALDWSSNLASSVWLPLLTNRAANNGALLFSVTNTAPVKLFRTRQLP
jgi:hypothetical protein